MGKVKLNEPRASYPSRESEPPEDALERALEEVRADRRMRDEVLLRTGSTVRRAWARRTFHPSPAH
ncbi:MAG: hypothetical protein ACRDO7_07780 [Nocardioidaceae bacterium]